MYLPTYFSVCLFLALYLLSQVPKKHKAFDAIIYWHFKKSESIAQTQPKLNLCLPSTPPPKKIFLDNTDE
jgi:hypothetical protein